MLAADPPICLEIPQLDTVEEFIAWRPLNCKAEWVHGQTMVVFPATLQEYLEWAPNNRVAEWIEGEMVVMSPASIRHQLVQQFLNQLLSTFVAEKELGQILSAPAVTKLRKTAREVDLVFIANENLHRMEEQYIDGRVDLAIEILSPSTHLIDQIAKRQEYAEAGIPEYWIIDPHGTESEFLTLVDGAYQLIEVGGGRVDSQVLPGLWLRPEWLQAERFPTVRELRTLWRML